MQLTRNFVICYSILAHLQHNMLKTSVLEGIFQPQAFTINHKFQGHCSQIGVLIFHINSGFSFSSHICQVAWNFNAIVSLVISIAFNNLVMICLDQKNSSLKFTIANISWAPIHIHKSNFIIINICIQTKQEVHPNSWSSLPS